MRLLSVAVPLSAALVLVGCDAAPTRGVASSSPTTTRPTASATTTPAATAAPAPSASPAPSPTPFDSVLPPERPAALDEPLTPEAAQEVGVYFLQLLPYTWATGDTAEFEALSTRGCEFCAAHLDGVDEMVAAGQHEVGNETLVDGTIGSMMDDTWLDYMHYEGATADVIVNAVQGPWKRLDARGKVVEKDATYVYLNWHLDVTKVNGRWKVREAAAFKVATSDEPIPVRPES